MKQSLFHSLKKKLFSGQLNIDVKDSFEDYLEEFIDYKTTINQLKQCIDSQSTAITTTMSNNQSIWKTLSSTFIDSEHPCKTQLNKVAEVYLVDPLSSEITECLSLCQGQLDGIIEQIAGIDKMVAIRSDYLKEYTYYHSKYTKLIQKAKNQQLRGKALAKKEQEKLQRNKDKLKNIKTLLEQVDENTVHVLDQFLFIRFDLLLPVITQYLTISKKMSQYHCLYLQKFPSSAKHGSVNGDKSTHHRRLAKEHQSSSSSSPLSRSSHSRTADTSTPSHMNSYSNSAGGDYDDGDSDDDSRSDCSSDQSEFDDAVAFHLDNIDALMAQSPSGITNQKQLMISFAPFDTSKQGGVLDPSIKQQQQQQPGEVMVTPHGIATTEGWNDVYARRAADKPRRSTLVSSLDSPSMIARPNKAKRNQGMVGRNQSNTSFDSISNEWSNPNDHYDSGCDNDNDNEDHENDDDLQYHSCKAAKTGTHGDGFMFEDSDLESEEEPIELEYMKKYKRMKAAAEANERNQRKSSMAKPNETHETHEIAVEKMVSTQPTTSITTNSTTRPELPTPDPPRADNNPFTDGDEHTTPQQQQQGQQQQQQQLHQSHSSLTTQMKQHGKSHKTTAQPDLGEHPTTKTATTSLSPRDPPIHNSGSALSDFSFAPPPSSLGSSLNRSSSSASDLLSSDLQHSDPLNHTLPPTHIPKRPSRTTSHDSSVLHPIHPADTPSTTNASHDGINASHHVIASTTTTVPPNPNIRRPPPPTQRIGEGNQLQLQRRPTVVSSAQRSYPPTSTPDTISMNSNDHSDPHFHRRP